MYKWLVRLSLAVLACVCAVVISCSSGGGGGGRQRLSGWEDRNDNGIYDPYEHIVFWKRMLVEIDDMIAGGFSLVAVAHAGVWVPWVDNNGNGVCDWADDPARWAQVCSAPWIDDNNDGICDNYYQRSGGGWVYLGEGPGKWQEVPAPSSSPATTSPSGAAPTSSPTATTLPADGFRPPPPPPGPPPVDRK